VEIANAPPEILSAPGGLDDDGVFRYAIEARDPDGDRKLRYHLNDGPEGMTVGPVSGEILWRPSTAHAGVHAVEVVVEDSEGANAVQKFEITIEIEEHEAAPAAMP
jgi:hypothetical protein